MDASVEPIPLQRLALLFVRPDSRRDSDSLGTVRPDIAVRDRQNAIATVTDWLRAAVSVRIRTCCSGFAGTGGHDYRLELDCSPPDRNRAPPAVMRYRSLTGAVVVLAYRSAGRLTLKKIPSSFTSICKIVDSSCSSNSRAPVSPLSCSKSGNIDLGNSTGGPRRLL